MQLAAGSVCPTYCVYCTRARAVGADTEIVKKDPYRPGRKRWDEIFAYIEANPKIQDIVISGGDSFYILPENIRNIGNRLINSEWPGQEHRPLKPEGDSFENPLSWHMGTCKT
jgi:L-lysine 2,3-aminomutase